ncbi:hypothetical protein [Leptospira yasudae]|uniref:Outer membrane protein beta-barrel domain-containing protein n=1 Tax=Leptospira yasudae TaxID=2202201 RepID=A0A6N4QD53_9LEPT|nr:hypothetical protein [Leptospira yasudae]TGL73647.1 hypothetical protein EHQ72_19325 [Leptospira yasudae]TGL80628.1 hypothetical protein EHQ77_07875 [Leptospira yasudae]TGL84262.1 hypothetical protein EHQ83_11275 [Leptospira yasudae]
MQRADYRSHVLILTFLLIFASDVFSQNIVPVPQNGPHEQDQGKNPDLRSDPNTSDQPQGLTQKEIRMKRKFFLGGIYFPGYGSTILGWNAWKNVTIGVQYYQNFHKTNGDYDSRYSYIINYGIARQSDREWKSAGGGIFVNYFIADSSVYIPIAIGGEYFRNTRYDQFIDTTGVQSYRSERINLDYGPRYYAGTGLGIRHQLESGFFFGFEILMRAFGPYHKNVTIETLDIMNRPVSVMDYWIRKEEIKRDHAGKAYDAGVDFSVGFAF